MGQVGFKSLEFPFKYAAERVLILEQRRVTDDGSAVA
jgi:hypothetical protein